MKKNKQKDKGNILSTNIQARKINKLLLLIFVLFFAAVGSALLLLTHAATPTASIEPETKTLSGNVITGTDSNASGGGFVQFKAPASGGGGTSTGNFHISGTNIVDPSGKNFVPIGANVGTLGQFDWWGDALGQSASAQQWGWNTIRLTLYVTDPFAAAGTATSRAQQIIDEYTAKGIVVILGDWSCSASPTTPSGCATQLAWMKNMATANKSNSAVWYNCYNEPSNADDAGWVALQEACTDTVRSAGNNSIIVADAPGPAADASWVGGSRVYASNMGPTVLAHDSLHNVLFSQHNYAGYCDSASEGTYLSTMHGAGLAVVIGEFGYTDDGSSTAGDYATNYACALANFVAAPSKSVGLLAWHGTHGDHYALRSSSQPFYGTAALSDFGSRLWTLTH